MGIGKDRDNPTRRSPGMIALVWGLVGLVSVSTAAQAQQAGGRGRAQASGAPIDQAATGRQLFGSTCQVCHGVEGVGNRGPSLRGRNYTTDYVRQVITEGRPGTIMPKFGGSLTSQQIDQLAQYVAGLPRQDPMWASLRGDEAEGRKVFFDASTAYSCHRCHTFMGAGARVGPDLTARVSRLSPREISQRILVVPHRET